MTMTVQSTMRGMRGARRTTSDSTKAPMEMEMEVEMEMEMEMKMEMEMDGPAAAGPALVPGAAGAGARRPTKSGATSIV